MLLTWWWAYATDFERSIAVRLAADPDGTPLPARDVFWSAIQQRAAAAAALRARTPADDEAAAAADPVVMTAAEALKGIAEGTPLSPSHVVRRTRPVRVVDTFPLNIELDLLLIRLTELEPVVDLFVLCESPYAYSGLHKPLAFADELQRSGGGGRFSRFLHKIVYVLVPRVPLYSAIATTVDMAWVREGLSRRALHVAVTQHIPLRASDLVLHSDLDEIPRATLVHTLKHFLPARAVLPPPDGDDPMRAFARGVRVPQWGYVDASPAPLPPTRWEQAAAAVRAGNTHRWVEAPTDAHHPGPKPAPDSVVFAPLLPATDWQYESDSTGSASASASASVVSGEREVLGAYEWPVQVVFLHLWFVFNFRWQQPQDWIGARAVRYGALLDADTGGGPGSGGGTYDLATIRHATPPGYETTGHVSLMRAGYHCTYCSSAADVVTKMERFSHWNEWRYDLLQIPSAERHNRTAVAQYLQRHWIDAGRFKHKQLKRVTGTAHLPPTLYRQRHRFPILFPPETE